MIKKVYVKPAIEIDSTDMREQLLAASLASVRSSGLDAEESLEYGDEDDKEKSLWDDAL